MLVAKSHLFFQDVYKAFLSSHIPTHLLPPFLRKQRNWKMCSSRNCESLENSFSFKHILCFFLKKTHAALEILFLQNVIWQEGKKKVLFFKIWKVFPCPPTLLVLSGVLLISTDPGFLESLLLPGISAVRSSFDTGCHEVASRKTQFSQYFPLPGKKNTAICYNSPWNKGR